MIPYYIDESVVGEARVSVENALKQWELKVKSPKFQLVPADHPNSLKIKLGDENGTDYIGYRPDGGNEITLKKDCRGEDGIYIVDILKQMGSKAGMGPL